MQIILCVMDLLVHVGHKYVDAWRGYSPCLLWWMGCYLMLGGGYIYKPFKQIKF